MRSTKIVATIGPASREPEVLEQMIAAGVDVMRLNFAHGNPEQHAETASWIRAAAELVGEGDVCYLADGAVRLRIDGISDGEVLARVEVGGMVASRQGINLPNVTVSLPAVSQED